MSKKEAISGFIVNFAESVHEHVFGEKMGSGAKRFLKNVSYLFSTKILAVPMTLLFTVIAARQFGPSEYGKFTLVQSIVGFMSLPICMGFVTATVKYSSEVNDIKRQSAIISTSLILLLITTCIWIPVFFFFSSRISSVFSIPVGIFLISIFACIVQVPYTISMGILRGLMRIKIFARINLLYKAIAFTALLVFVFLGLRSFEFITCSFYLPCIVLAIAIVVLFVRKYLIFKINKAWAKILAKYAVFAIIGGVSHVFYTNTDKILIKRFMDFSDVGIYQAYYFASIGLASLFAGIFNTVLFPTASGYRNKEKLLGKIDRMVPVLIVLGTPTIMFCEFIILKIYGDKYPINILMIFLFAVTSVIVVWYELYSWMFCSIGVQGVKLRNIAIVTIAVSNIAMNVSFIPRYGLYGAIVSTLVAFILGICCLYFLKSRMLRLTASQGLEVINSACDGTEG